ncbi:MAG: hypothetical protein NC336_07130 [Clostridium sp.]|nr:hypothetical protein [Clostridium sp.]
MEHTEDKNYRRLRSVCRKFLASPATFEIDIDHLLDLFDYALDNSEYNCAWVLVSIGNALFPDDDSFILKTAYLAYMEGDNELALELLDRVRIEPMWVETMRLMITAGQDSAEVARSLQRIVSQSRRLDNETLLNILTVAHEHDLYREIKSLCPEIERHADDMIDFYLDLEEWAEENGDTDYAAQILERLTTIAPMDIDLWIQSAAFNLSICSNPDEAATEVEYALAIDPSNRKARILDAQIRIVRTVNAHDREGSEKAFGDLLESVGKENLSESDIMIIDWASEVLELSADERVTEIYYGYNREHPEDRKVLTHLLAANENSGENEICEFLLKQNFDAELDNDEAEWIRWSQEIRSRGLYRLSLLVMETFYSLTETTFAKSQVQTVFLETLYLRGRFDAICSLEKEICASEQLLGLPYMVMHLILSKARTGDWTGVPTLCTLLGDFDSIPGSWLNSMSVMACTSLVEFSGKMNALALLGDRSVEEINNIDPHTRLLREIVPDVMQNK